MKQVLFCIRLATIRLATAGLVLACSVWCAAGCSVRSGEPMMRTELYFGTHRKHGVPVDSVEWVAFRDTCIARLFADGFTVFDAYGQWRNDSGTIEREQSRVLVVVHPDTDEFERRIEEVRVLYNRVFQQESVLRVTSPVRVAF